jgi:hypothetical protein
VSERAEALLDAARVMCKHCAAGLELLHGVPDKRFGAWSHRRPVRPLRGEVYTVPVGCKAGPIQELRNENWVCCKPGEEDPICGEIGHYGEASK